MLQVLVLDSVEEEVLQNGVERAAMGYAETAAAADGKGSAVARPRRGSRRLDKDQRMFGLGPARLGPSEKCIVALGKSKILNTIHQYK